MSEGDYQVILCERGVRTFADHTRNTLDLSIIPAIRALATTFRSLPIHPTERAGAIRSFRSRALPSPPVQIESWLRAQAPR